MHYNYPHALHGVKFADAKERFMLPSSPTGRHVRAQIANYQMVSVNTGQALINTHTRTAYVRTTHNRILRQTVHGAIDVFDPVTQRFGPLVSVSQDEYLDVHRFFDFDDLAPGITAQMNAQRRAEQDRERSAYSRPTLRYRAPTGARRPIRMRHPVIVTQSGHAAASATPAAACTPGHSPPPPYSPRPGDTWRQARHDSFTTPPRSPLSPIEQEP